MSMAAPTGITRFVEPVILACVPLSLGACAALRVDFAAGATLVVVALAVIAMLVGFDRSRPALRQIMPCVVLAAVAAAGRILFAPIPDVKPVSAICIVCGAVLGRREGFACGALAALASNVFFGQGPWTPWQMYAWGLVGYVSGVLASHGTLERTWARTAWAFSSALLYGLLLNGWYVVGFVVPLTWPGALAAFAAGLPWDCIHGVATVVFLTLIWQPWGTRLRAAVARLGL